MAVTINSKTGDSGASGNTTPIPSSVGNLIIVVLIFDVVGSVTSITDNQGNTYVSCGVTTTYDGTSHAEIWYAKNATTGVTAVTENFSATGGRFEIYDCSGADGTAPLDGTPQHADSQPSSTSPSLSITPSVAGDAVIAVELTGGNTTAVASPFTLDGTPNGHGVASEGSASSGIQTATFTTLNSAWGELIAAFKPPSAATPGFAPYMRNPGNRFGMGF